MPGHTMFHFLQLHVEIFNFSFYSYSLLVAFHFHFNIHFQGVSLASYKVVLLEQHPRCHARHLFPPFKWLGLAMIQTNTHLLWCRKSVCDVYVHFFASIHLNVLTKEWILSEWNKLTCYHTQIAMSYHSSSQVFSELVEDGNCYFHFDHFIPLLSISYFYISFD